MRASALRRAHAERREQGHRSAYLTEAAGADALLEGATPAAGFKLKLRLLLLGGGSERRSDYQHRSHSNNPS